MAEIPNLRQFKGGIFLDMDNTLAPSTAGLDLLYGQVELCLPQLTAQQLVAERRQQRRLSYASVGGDPDYAAAPPYDVYQHLLGHGVEAEFVDEWGEKVASEHPKLLRPDAMALLGGLCSAPTILTHGHEPTQRLKARLNGLDIYPIVVVNGDRTKPEYMNSLPFWNVLVDDRPVHLQGLAKSAVGILYDPAHKYTGYEGLRIARLDQLLEP